MKRVFQTIRPLEADMVCIALRDHGIESHLEGDEGAWVAWAGPAAPWTVYVHEKDLDQAMIVVRDSIEAQKRAREVGEEGPSGPGAQSVT